MAKAKPLVQMFTAWSLSRLLDWERCPKRAHAVHVLKIKEAKETNAAMERGAAYHKLAENYIIGKLRAFPIELMNVKKQLDLHRAAYKKGDASVEGKWAFTDKWKPVEFFDMQRAWLRTVLDAALKTDKGKRIIVTDWKTGKYNEERIAGYTEQLELYAPGTFAMYPAAVEIEAKLEFIDARKTERKVYTLKQVPAIQKKWEKRVAGMLADRSFVARPGGYCKRCHLSRSNGGPCKY